MATKLQVYFATNRDLQDESAKPWFGKRFNPDGPYALRFGTAEGRRRSDGSYRVSKVTVAPETLAEVGSDKRVLGSKFVLEALRANMITAGGRDTLVLIHGFAAPFETTIERGLELSDKYRPNGKPLNIVVFSWPANGEMRPFMSYYSDRDDARNSGEAMARAMLIVKEFIELLSKEERCDRSVHLLAHSMGNYALRYGVQHLRRHVSDELPRLFGEIILAAADVDDDCFDHDFKLRLLPRLGRRVSVYFAPQDRALFISDNTKGNPDRLGSDGPKQISGLPAKVVLVDCREVALDNDMLTAHQYYHSSKRAVYDVVRTLEGLAPDKIKGRVHVPELRAWRVKKAMPSKA